MSLLMRLMISTWKLHTQLVYVLQSLLDPYPNELTEARPIWKRINDSGYERPDVIEPIDIGEQSGLGEF